MLRESLKWMLLTLLIAALVIGGIVVAFRALRPSGQSPQAVPPDALDAALATPEEQLPTPTPTAAPTQTPTPTPEPTPLPDTADELLRVYISDMTTEEKIGQMVLFGFTGTNAPSGTFAKILEQYQVGNIIYYGANIVSDDSDGGFNRASRLTEACRARMATEIAPLVAIDVEGGSVVRFRWGDWPASARTLGRSGDEQAAETQFANIGRRLISSGINLNLAPVLDVSENPMRTFLQTRIISADARIAADIGAAIVRGLHDVGCLSTAKHFPGHGGTTADSHDTTPVVNRTRQEMLEYDLVPFIRAVDGGVDAILVAHILYPALDETDIASMSQPVITGLLREQLGFTGIVISDDFRMAGLTSRYDVSKAAVQFVLAGGDMIMCGAQHDKQEAIMRGLLSAAEDGTLSQTRINESVFRILKKKLTATDWTLNFGEDAVEALAAGDAAATPEPEASPASTPEAPGPESTPSAIAPETAQDAAATPVEPAA